MFACHLPNPNICVIYMEYKGDTIISIVSNSPISNVIGKTIKSRMVAFAPKC